MWVEPHTDLQRAVDLDLPSGCANVPVLTNSFSTPTSSAHARPAASASAKRWNTGVSTIDTDSSSSTPLHSADAVSLKDVSSTCSMRMQSASTGACLPTGNLTTSIVRSYSNGIVNAVET